MTTPLSIIHFDEENKRYLVEFREGKFSGKCYVGRWRVCGNPFCGCANVDFHCAEFLPEASGDKQDGSEGGGGSDLMEHSPVVNFSLDIRRKAFAGARNAHDRKIGKEMARGLTLDDWQRLSRLLHSTKAEQIREVDVDSVDLRDVDFPQRIFGGAMVGYVEIFPFAPDFAFTMEGERFIVDDMYCVQPGCECAQTVLTFISPEQGHRSLPIVRYDHGRSRPVEVLEESGVGQPAPGEFVRSLKEAHPDLSRELVRRNKQLRRLYFRSLQSKEAPHRESGSGPTQAKVGRNDPCPCGSGKKFKKCCG